MHISEMPALKNEWYAVGPVEGTRGTSRAVTLFGEEYVLWVSNAGDASLTQPYCPHRGAHLSAACVQGDHLVCCYHGWEFTTTGSCARVPQLEPGVPIPPKAKLATWPVIERYGMWWACIGEPSSDGPPPWFEADELGWRVQVDFFEVWDTCALRIIDNNIDQSHPAFVHQGTFGDPSQPLVPRYDVVQTDAGFKARIVHEVAGVGPQMGIDDVNLRFERVTEVELLSPVQTRILLAYDGLAHDYCFYGSATPLDDERSIYVRLSALSADEAQQPYAMFHDYSRKITLEDKVVLETTHGDFPVDVTSEVHLRCDKTTLEYRRILGRLVAAPSSDAPSPGAANVATGRHRVAGERLVAR